MSLLHDVLFAFGSGVCVQTFASTGLVDGHDLQPQGSFNFLAFASKGRQKTSCLNICKTVASILRAYHHGVVGGCSRGEKRSGGGFTSHSGRFAVAGRESDYGASPQATSRVGQTAMRGASPKSTTHNAQHQWLTESHIRLAVGSLPTRDYPPGRTTP